MAKKHYYAGAVLPWTNGLSADVASGDLVLVNDLAGIALGDIDDGDDGLLAIEEVWALPALPLESITQGSRIYHTDGHGFVSTGVSAAATWVADTAYDVGDYAIPTTPNDHYYLCVLAGTSDTPTEPTWPEDGDIVTDGTAVWLDMGDIQDIGIAFAPVTGVDGEVWVASTAYAEDDLVVPVEPNGHYYKCIDHGEGADGDSDSTEPEWPTDGSTVVDNEVTWQDMGLVTAQVKLNA